MMAISCSLAIFLMDSMSAGIPKICTTTMALDLEVIFSFKSFGQRVKDSSSTSTKMGLAPIFTIGSMDAWNVQEGTKTSSPSCIPSANMAASIAEVPLQKDKACFVPK